MSVESDEAVARVQETLAAASNIEAWDSGELAAAYAKTLADIAAAVGRPQQFKHTTKGSKR